MKQNYLYKCTDCHTVRAASEDWGTSTWMLSCRACGNTVTEHYLLEVNIVKDTHLENVLLCQKCTVECSKDKEENDPNT